MLLGAGQQTRTKSTSETFEVTTPEGMQRYSNEYYKYKLQKSTEHIQTLQKILATETEMNLEEVPGLLLTKKVRPKKTKSTRITSVHRSMAGSGILKKLQLVENEKEEADRRKENQAKEKDDLRRNFEWCKDACVCDGECCVKDYKQCPNCFYVMKTVCSKKGCRREDGTKPTMIILNNASMSKGKQQAVKK